MENSSSTAIPNDPSHKQKQQASSNIEANTFSYNDKHFEEWFLRVSIHLPMESLYSIAVPIDPEHTQNKQAKV